MDQQFVCLATIADVNLAQVTAARLQSEGLTVRLHGEAMGPFRLTLGGLAETQLWVAATDTDLATAVLEDAGIACRRQDLHGSGT